jgi:EmrB/QacA subfamily drug resistance transporter
VLIATVLGSGMALLDTTAVNVALPQIGRDFGVGIAGLQWTLTGYTLTLSAFLLLGGALGDRYGRRRLFVIGSTWFALASMACGLAPSAGALIAFRALQGVGGALLTPASLAIIEASFVQDDRGRAIGAWSGLGGVFGAVGPLLGGFLVQAASWRLVFFINLPIAAVAGSFAMLHVPESKSPGYLGSLDTRGPVLVALGLGGVTYALIEGSSRGWNTPAILASVGGGALLLVSFLVNEARLKNPLLPLDMFASRAFSGANGATFAIYAALGAVTFLLVLQLEDVLHYTPLAAGVSLLPLTLVMLLFSSRSGRLASKIGPRIPMTVGPLVAAVGMALFARVDAGTTYASTVLPAALVFGFGLVLTVPALTTTALGAVEAERSGIASAVNNDTARLASIAAVAVIPALAGITTSGKQLSATQFSSGFRAGMFICAGLCAIGGLVAALTVGRGAKRARQATCMSCPVSGPPVAASDA